jgi:Ser/Thr protein kinase RdoA (MazF antagonist)
MMHDFDSSPHEQHELLNLNEVMHLFGVRNWQNLGPSDDVNSVSLIVEIEGQRYLLHERPEGLVEEDLSHRYAFQDYLRQTGIPIPPFFLTPQREPVVTLGDESFELQQWANGEWFSTADPRSLDWVSFAGRMLGRIHRASSEYNGPVHRWPPEIHIGSLVQRSLSLARARADASEIQAVAAALSQWADSWEAALPQAMMTVGAGKALPEFHIHGDYHALNLRFGTFGVTSVIGFEASRWEKRIFEVANGLFSFSALSWLAGSGETRPLVKRGLEPERARRFLQAYGEVYPPVAGEASLLVDALLLIAPLAIINGPLEALFYEQEEPDATLIEEMLDRIAWTSSLPAWLARVRNSLAEMWK